MRRSPLRRTVSPADRPSGIWKLVPASVEVTPRHYPRAIPSALRRLPGMTFNEGADLDTSQVTGGGGGFRGGAVIGGGAGGIILLILGLIFQNVTGGTRR